MKPNSNACGVGRPGKNGSAAKISTRPTACEITVTANIGLRRVAKPPQKSAEP